MLSRSATKSGIYLIPFASFFAFLFVKTLYPAGYYLIVQEDGLLENAQAIFYFLSSIISGVAAWNFYKQEKFVSAATCIAIAGLLGFVGFEEISWFQRVLSIKSPAFFLEHNKQDEITLHNLKPVQKVLHIIYIIVCGFCSFSCLFKKHILYKLGGKIAEAVELLIPEKFVSSFFYPGFTVYLFYEFVVSPSDWSFLIWRDQEPVELLISTGFTIVSLVNWRRSCIRINHN